MELIDNRLSMESRSNAAEFSHIRLIESFVSFVYQRSDRLSDDACCFPLRLLSAHLIAPEGKILLEWGKETRWIFVIPLLLPSTCSLPSLEGKNWKKKGRNWNPVLFHIIESRGGETEAVKVDLLAWGYQGSEGEVVV